MTTSIHSKRNRIALLGAAIVIAMLGLATAPIAAAQATTTPWGQVGADIVGRADAVALSDDGATLVAGDAAMGVVRVFRATDNGWQQYGETIDPSSELFGISVDIDEDGDTIVVGSRGNAGGISDVARAYRFDGAWTQVGRTVISSDPGPLGSSVAISGDGNVIAVTRRVSTVDQVSVYRLVSGDWVDVGNTLLSGPAVSDVALSPSGKALAMSSLLGGSQVFRLAPLGNEWEQVNGDLPSASGVAINSFGSIVVLALPGDNLARVYRDVGGSWLAGGNFVGEAADDSAGAAVAMSADGSVIAVGAPGNDHGGDNAGHVRIYELDGALWKQAAPDIDGKAAAELTGWALAMDADGTRIAIGAPGQTRVFSPAAAQDDETSILAAETVLVDVLANDGADLGASLSVLTQPTQAVATVEANQIRYTPAISTSTTDSFTYQLCVNGNCSTATVSVSITPPTCRRQSLAPLVATIWGTEGTDTITAGDDDDVIVSFGGDDIIDAGNGLNTICAGEGNDRITSGDQPDFIRGDNGDDTISSGLGIDRIFGGNGNDLIDGEGGSDRIRGAGGNDIIHAGSGADRVWGGSGNDTMFGNGGKDTMYGDAGNDTMQGNFQSDVMRGGPGDDTVRGAGGKDKLYGDAGNDMLFGGLNTDYLEGGSGTDTANGQQGKDNPLVADQSGCDAETVISC